MSTPRKFLLLEDNSNGEFLLYRTLIRKFPDAVVQACLNSADAVQVVANEQIAAVIVHRAADLDGIPTVKKIREAAPHAVIIMVSGIDRSREALEAGADRFHPYDKWLIIGNVVEEEINRRAGPA